MGEEGKVRRRGCLCWVIVHWALSHWAMLSLLGAASTVAQSPNDISVGDAMVDLEASLQPRSVDAPDAVTRASASPQGGAAASLLHSLRPLRDLRSSYDVRCRHAQ